MNVPLLAAEIARRIPEMARDNSSNNAQVIGNLITEELQKVAATGENGGNGNRRLFSTLPNGMKLYQVKLVGGPGDGQLSLCSHDTVYWGGQLYMRGGDDRYYFTKPEELNRKN